MIIHSHIYKDNGLFLQKYLGEFSVKDYKDAALKIISKPDFKFVRISLFDFRELTFSGSEDIIDELISFRKEIKIQDIRTVYLVSSPLATVLAHLYIDQIKSDNYIYCTTVEKAISILDLETSSANLEAMLLQLK